MMSLIKKILNPLVLIFVVLFFVIVLTWIPHEDYFTANGVDSSDYGDLQHLIPDNGKYGILDSSYSIWYGLVQMFPTFLYVLVVSMIFLTLHWGGVIEVFFKDLQKGTNNNKYIFTTLIFTLIFLSSSILGFFEQFIILLPMLWLNFDKLGIDKRTSTITLILSTTMGRSFSTLSPYAFQMGYSTIDGWEELNQYILLRFSFMILGLVTGLIIINILIRFTKNEPKTDERTLNSKEFIVPSKKRVYTGLSILFLMCFILILGSINWSSIFGDDWNIINTFIKNTLWFITSTWNSIGKWGNPEKVILISTFLLILFMIYKKEIQINSKGDKLLNTAILSMLKVYIVFSIAKGISLILIYSGLAASTAQLITWKKSQAAFLIAMIPIFLVITFLMNAQTGAFLIFTPFVWLIISNSNFDNPELVLAMYMHLLSLITGINAMLTPTQSMNAIPVEMSDIQYKDYYKIMIPIAIVIVFIFGILIFPAVALI